MIKTRLLTLLFLFISPITLAGNIVIGQALPEVNLAIKDGGELFLVNNEVEYRDWNSKKLTGKTRVIYHLAARMGIDKVNSKTMSAMESLTLSQDKFSTVSIINADDVAFGASSFAKREVEKNRKKHPGAEFVLDMESTIQKAWNLKRKSSTLLIIDPDNKVLFFKDGKLSENEHQTFLEILKEQAG